MNGYIISLRKDNFENIRDSGYSLVGFTEHCKIAEKLQPGDQLIIYVASGISKFVGVLEVSEKYYWDTELLWDDIYPKRVKTAPKIILKDDKWVDVRKIKDSINFITNKENPKFGVYFMQGIRKLTEADYEFISAEIKKANV